MPKNIDYFYHIIQRVAQNLKKARFDFENLNAYFSRNVGFQHPTDIMSIASSYILSQSDILLPHFQK